MDIPTWPNNSFLSLCAGCVFSKFCRNYSAVSPYLSLPKWDASEYFVFHNVFCKNVNRRLTVTADGNRVILVPAVRTCKYLQKRFSFGINSGKILVTQVGIPLA